MRSMIAGLAAIGAIVLVAGCSGSSSPPAPTPSSVASSNPNVVDGITIPPAYIAPKVPVVAGPTTCPAGFATTLARAGRTGSFHVQTEATAHLLTCKYANRQAAAGTCSRSTILINTEPQAYTAFDRWNVETGQNSMWGNNPRLRPTPVPGIGIEAEWAPAILNLGTASASTWVSVFLTCPTPSNARILALAEALARIGLASTSG